MTRTATPRKPRARSQDRIDAILDAARTLLAAEGVSSLSIYSVADRGGNQQSGNQWFETHSVFLIIF